MGALSWLRRVLFGPPKAPPKPPEPPKIPPKPPEPPKPPQTRMYEVTLTRTITRGKKSRPADKDRIDVRQVVRAVSSDEAVHVALRAIGDKVPDGYISFFERVGLYSDPPRVSETSYPGDGKIHLYRHSGGSMKGEASW